MRDRNMGNKTRRRRTKKQKLRNKIIVFVFEILLLLLLVGGIAFVAKFKDLYGRIDKGDQFGNNSEAGINTDISTEQQEVLKGYTNIAIFGLDNRSVGNYEKGLSDVIMIASINNETKEVKIVSVYRDTYLSIGDGKYKKANTAYSTGGAKQAVQMLNSNLDLDIAKYVCVDWAALVEAIDALGGIEIEVTKQEVSLINSYLWEIDEVTGENSKKLKGSGKMTLSGTQATAYARIRKTAGDDFRRASRQRIVLEAMLNKAKQSDLNTLLDICEAVFDDISTNITLAEIIDLAMDVQKYEIGSTTGFPFDLVTRSLSGTGDTVVPVSLENNVSKLHAYMFGTEGYVPSFSVQAISNAIIEKTGVDEDTKPYNMDDYNNTAGQDGTVFD